MDLDCVMLTESHSILALLAAAVHSAMRRPETYVSPRSHLVAAPDRSRLRTLIDLLIEHACH
jgi:hypothetical protein